jgi:hypothetical protein
MADSNSGSPSTGSGQVGDKAQGQYSDGLLRLVEETDKEGAICYCVECCKTGDLLYSSNSKPQAFSFAEGYRARDGEGASTPRKPKADDSNGDNTNDDKAKPTQNVDPAKVQRKRAVI